MSNHQSTFHEWFEHCGIYFGFRNQNKKRTLIYIGAQKISLEKLPDGLPLFQLAVAGRTNGFWQMLITAVTEIPLESEALDLVIKDNEVVIPYFHRALGLKIEVHWQLIPNTKVIRSWTEVFNQSHEKHQLTHLSSGIWSGLSQAGLRSWWDSEKWKIHTCQSGWKREGQWFENTFAEKGLYPVAEPLPIRSAAHLQSIGSFSTSRANSTALLENRDAGIIYYGQIESSGAWHHEWSIRGTQNQGSLYWQMDVANETVGGWSYLLLPGESYKSEKVAFGCCTGGFNEGIAELTRYRRSILKPASPWKEECPLIFNDYMNCWWGDPTLERLLPLIDTTSQLGVEVFCIDAGWFGKKGADWNFGLGDWIPGDDRFGVGGLQSVIDLIRQKGMIPGLWLELEVCGEQTELAKKPDAWFLRRYSKRIGGGDRWFLDLSNGQVRSYLHQVIDRLVGMGVGYFKNDYNSCVGYGAEKESGSCGQGILDHLSSFYSFIDEVRSKHPTLIIENCGGGGLRQDYGTLSHFHLQSFSDVEVYTEAPSVLSGSLANVLPEQLGIWCYPLRYDYSKYLENPKSNSLPDSKIFESGEETIFNGVNGLCGNLYLSGRLDGADELNRMLLQEALSIYKKERLFIANAIPFWPQGHLPVLETKRWHSFALKSEKTNRCLLAVWRLESHEEIHEIFFPEWKASSIQVRQIYPKKSHQVEFTWAPAHGKLSFRFLSKNQARFFEILF